MAAGQVVVDEETCARLSNAFIPRSVFIFTYERLFFALTRIIIEKFCFLQKMFFKDGLYRIWCGVNRLGDSGEHTLGDTSAFVNPAGQLLLTQRGKTRMDGVGIVFEFYIGPL